jgi:hypothetical protein
MAVDCDAPLLPNVTNPAKTSTARVKFVNLTESNLGISMTRTLLIVVLNTGEYTARSAGRSHEPDHETT